MLEIDMMADSQMPTDQGLGKISTLAEEYTELDEEIKDAETRLKLLKERERTFLIHGNSNHFVLFVVKFSRALLSGRFF